MQAFSHASASLKVVRVNEASAWALSLEKCLGMEYMSIFFMIIFFLSNISYRAQTKIKVFSALDETRL